MKEILSLISPPIIGAIIGYFTNLLAVKMLFHPYKKIYFFKIPLPFTPGVIPIRKPQVARALGRMVGETLVGKSDIKNMLLSDKVKNTLYSTVDNVILNLEKTELKEFLHRFMSDESYENSRKEIKEKLSEKLYLKLSEADFKDIIMENAKGILYKNVGGWANILTDSMYEKISVALNDSAHKLIEEKGRPQLEDIIDKAITSVENKKLEKATKNLPINEIKERIIDKYCIFIEDNYKDIAQMLNISETVEAKINEMNVASLEKMIVTVMNTELRALVDLGAVIGFILGLFNLLFLR